MSGGPFHIPSLDGLRAVSIAIVFVSHAGVSALPGGFGVTVFFFLSGYLITTLLRREFEANGSVSYRDFYLRRAWRIFPPMYAALALGVVTSVVGATNGQPTVPAVSLQALHLTNYAGLAGFSKNFPLGTHVFWSLAVEEHFYLLFPVCAVFLLRRFEPRTQAAALLGFCGVVLAWRVILVVAFDPSTDRTFTATDTRIDAILFGCALGLHLNPALKGAPRPSSAVAVGVTVASLAVIAASMVYRDEFYRETIRYTVQSAALAPIFYFAVQRPTLWLFRLLNNSWVAFVGVLSYSLYLVHHIVIFVVKTQWPDLGLASVLVVTAAVSMALAYGFHLAIEKPAARMRKRYAVALQSEPASQGRPVEHHTGGT